MARNLRQAAKGQTCTVCGRDSETVVLAHLRVGLNGGMGIKPPDHHAVYACADCHRYMDGPGRADHKTQLIAHLRQIDRWLAEGRLVLT